MGDRFLVLDRGRRAGRCRPCGGTGLCAEAKWSRALSLVAKAWIGNWDVSTKVEIPVLSGDRLRRIPWTLPTGCDDTTTPDSLLGGGVTKADDAVTGGPDQWGHVDGFAPGKKTWVLSTGLISNAVGDPDSFASTDLGWRRR